jgi:hypothetical protein
MKGGDKMKKEWQTPVLEVLNVNMTMAGAGHAKQDEFQNDPDDPFDKYS